MANASMGAKKSIVEIAGARESATTIAFGASAEIARARHAASTIVSGPREYGLFKDVILWMPVFAFAVLSRCEYIWCSFSE